jgi:hypothetical protein
MGRYAFFSTGYEYKFVFACQESDEIELFGGEVTNIDEWNAKIVWKKEEVPTIKRTMKYLLFLNELEEFNVEIFEKTIDGTYLLNNELWKRLGNKGCYKTILCCLIYHQLLYTDELSCNYER